MLDPALVLSRLGGVARGSRLQGFGISRKALAAHVRAGRIRRLRPGVFACNTLAADIAAAARHGGALTCEAALQRHGIWTISQTPGVHVWMGSNGRLHPHDGCSCVSHFFNGDTAFGIASIETALCHLFSCGGEEAFFVSFESAWNRRLLSRSARSRIRAALPASARWLVDFARPDADSGLESLMRLRLRLLGIAVECQVLIDGVGKVDFVVDGRLIIETDGKANHDGASNRHKDLVRDAAASRLGYETLRFDYAQIVHDWPSVQRAILAALRRVRG